MIVYDPRVPNDQRGRRCDEMILNVDLAPTFLSWAGLGVPVEMQGSSLAPLVCGEKIPWRKEFYHEFTWTAEGRIEPSEGIRSVDWKYIRYFNQKPAVEQLFDLRKDPGETTDLSSNPDFSFCLQEMRVATDRYRSLLQSGHEFKDAGKAKIDNR